MLAIVAIVLVVAGVFAYWWYQSTRYPSSNPEVSTPDVNEPRSEEEANLREEGNRNQGQDGGESSGAVDTGGEDASDGDQTGITSRSGNITLYTPQSGQTLTSQSRLSGAAKTNEVHYRLKDNVSGVIGQGALGVNDGLFSGNLRVNTSGTEGTLELYTFSADGREVNRIEIQVRY